jgi:hypothetical protein
MLTVFRDALPAFAADLGHMLSVPRHGLAAFAGDLFARIGIHRGGSARAGSTGSLASFDRATFLILRHGPLRGDGDASVDRMCRWVLSASFHRLTFRPRLVGLLLILLAVICHSSSVYLDDGRVVSQ